MVNFTFCAQVSIRTPAACVAKVEKADRNSKTAARPMREIVTPAGYRIPEKLTIKPQGRIHEYNC